jgi:hypothetical protein
MSASLRPCAPGSREHLPHPRSGPHCVQTRALQLWFQLWEMRHDGNQRKMGPPADPISGCGINLALKQLHHRGHRCCQRRRPVGTVQHQAPNLRSRSPQSLKLNITLSLCSQLCPKLSGGLVHMISQSGLTGWWPKEQVIDSHDRPLKP